MKTSANKIVFDKDKKLEIKRVKTIACAITHVPIPDLNKENDNACVARILIMTYLLNKGYSKAEVSFVARINVKNINDNLEKYQRLRSRNVDFANIESNFKRKIELCCAKA
jgi:hypothetical protein